MYESVLYDAKAQTYAEFGNGVVIREVQRALPRGGRLLDVGCASGGLLARMRDRAGHLAGIEISPVAAQRAAAVADEIVVAAVEDAELPDGSFDVVVLADVLEHLGDPERALRRAIAWTRPGGEVIVSLPNVAHWSARAALLRGRWPVEESGIFDATHLHFFDYERSRALMRDSGLVDVRITPVVPALRNYGTWWYRLPAPLAHRLEALWQLIARRRPNLFGYQLVASGRRPDS